MAGYSGTPLARKLGIKADHRVALVAAPPSFPALLGELPPGVLLQQDAKGKEPFDVILFFARSLEELRRRFAELAERLVPTGGLWVAWPKKASGVVTDLSENPARDIGLAAGLVDNKVCAVDETWSGLRFVYRLKDRPQPVRG
jgi:hypothetical protein